MKEYVRTILDYPVKGIEFRDITTLLQNAGHFKKVIDEMTKPWINYKIDAVLSIESRGFIMAGAIAYKLNADGVHLNSLLLHSLSEIPKDLLVSASCHSARDIEKAMTMDVSFVVLSPVQKTQSHPNTTPIGWDDFSKITQNYSIPIYALGGMKQDDIENAFNAGAIGIASQRAIWEA